MYEQHQFNRNGAQYGSNRSVLSVGGGTMGMNQNRNGPMRGSTRSFRWVIIFTWLLDHLMTLYLVQSTLEWINNSSWGHNNHWTCINNSSSNISNNTIATIMNFIKCKQQQLSNNSENRGSISCRVDVEQDQFLQFIRFNHVQVKKWVELMNRSSSMSSCYARLNFVLSLSLKKEWIRVWCDEDGTWHNAVSYDITWCQQVSIIWVMLQNSRNTSN